MVGFPNAQSFFKIEIFITFAINCIHLPWLISIVLSKCGDCLKKGRLFFSNHIYDASRNIYDKKKHVHLYNFVHFRWVKILNGNMHHCWASMKFDTKYSLSFLIEYIYIIWRWNQHKRKTKCFNFCRFAPFQNTILNNCNYHRLVIKYTWLLDKQLD
jgi:hypothetical protein